MTAEDEAKRRAAAKRKATNERKAAEARAKVIREELERHRTPACRCALSPQSTLAEIRALGAGCTAGRWVCDTLAAIRRRLSH